RLNLSTNNPYANKTKPELYPWYLDYYTYRNDQYNAKKTTGDNRSQAYGSSIPALSSNEQEGLMTSDDFNAQTSMNFSSMIEQLISIEYAIDLPYSIKSDNEMNMVLISSKSLSTEYLYYA